MCFHFSSLWKKMHLYKPILLSFFSFFFFFVELHRCNFKHTVVATKCLNTQNITTELHLKSLRVLALSPYRK